MAPKSGRAKYRSSKIQKELKITEAVIKDEKVFGAVVTQTLINCFAGIYSNKGT